MTAATTAGKMAFGNDVVPKVRESWLTAAIPMDNPYCSCKLTRVLPQGRRLPFYGHAESGRRGVHLHGAGCHCLSLTSHCHFTAFTGQVTAFP